MKRLTALILVICFAGVSLSLISAEPKVIEVQIGDTLWDIAEKHLGDGRLWRAIADYNNIKDPDLIYPGNLFELKIPEIARVKFTAAAGEVKIKKAETKEVIKAKEGSHLWPYDEVIVGANSRAQLELEDKSTVRVKPETSIRLKESLFREEKRGLKTKIELLLGRISVRVNRLKNPEFEVETPTGVCGIRGSQVLTEYTPDEIFKISVFKGEARAVAAGKEVDIPAGHGSQIVKGEPPSLPTPLLQPSELVMPENGYATDLPATTFEWKPVSGAANYHFELSRDKAFNDVVYEMKETEATSISTALKPGRYYWHVSSIDSFGLEGRFGQVRQVRALKPGEKDYRSTVAGTIFIFINAILLSNVIR